MSCSSAPKRSACPRVSSLASGSPSSGATAGPSLAEHAPRGRAAGRSSRPARRGCDQDVEMVKARSARHPAGRRARAGRPRSRRARPSASSPASARSEAISRRSSANIRSAATSASAGALAPSQRERVGLDREVKLGGQPGQAQRAQRIGAERRRATTARSRRAARSSSPPIGSISGLAAASGRAIALTVRSRRARSASIDSPSSGSQVDLPAAVAGDHPPGAERLREGEGMPAGVRAPARARRAGTVAGSGGRPRRSRRSRGRAARRARRRRPATPPRRDRAPGLPSGSLTPPAPRHGGTRADPGRDPAQDLMGDRADPVGQVLGGLALARRRGRSGSPASRARHPRRRPGPRSTVMLSMLTVPTSG